MAIEHWYGNTALLTCNRAADLLTGNNYGRDSARSVLCNTKSEFPTVVIGREQKTL